MFLTVFTPTYNRAHLLPRLYESLKAQTCLDFEWLIVDDGSTDNTEQMVRMWCKEEYFKGGTHYIRQPNGGKHRAINHGVTEAKGKLFFIVDSDDSLPEDSIKTIFDYWLGIRDDTSFGGIVGFIAHHDGTVIGHGYSFDILDCSTLDFRYKFRVNGDMAEVYRTDVLKEFPFLEIENEKFCPEALVWNRVATKYRLRHFNKIIYFRDYLDGGLTSKIVQIRMNNPIGTITTYQELNSYSIPFLQKIKAAINYWRFYACIDRANNVPKLPWYWFWCRPLGFVMHLKDKR